MSNSNGVYRPAALVGEVIESSTTQVLAQACQLDAAPAFGSFVRISGGDGGLETYAVVAQVQTAGIDPGARAVMRGHGEVRDDLIYRENPDLPLVLRTTFRCAVVGFESGAAVYQLLPPSPPRLHYSVFVVTAEEVRRFTDAGLDYLRTLLSTAEAATDEMVAANIRLTGQLRGEPDAFSHCAGRELAELLRTDYARLTAILRRCILLPLVVPSDERATGASNLGASRA
jgi:hypothetical protein